MRATLIKPQRSLITDAVAYSYEQFDFAWVRWYYSGTYREQYEGDLIGYFNQDYCNPFDPPPWKEVEGPDGDLMDIFAGCP